MAQSSHKTSVATQRRERAQALRAERQRQEARRRRLIGISVVTAVAVVLGVVVVVGVLTHKKAGSGTPRTPAAASVVAATTGVPASVFNTVGKGVRTAAPKPLQAAPLTSNGKPELLYVGAEYCPYCAAERWAMVTALSRFGTFKNLGAITSSSTDVFPSTSTFTFYGASYSSPYLTFTPKEVETNIAQGTGYTRLDKLDAQQAKLFSTTGQNAFPFLDIGGKYVLNGPQYTPQVLQGKSMAQISAALADPTTDISKSVLGSANYLTAAICNLTKGQPAAVCTSPAVAQLASQLG
jgi:thiol-disulfide isomerase/thioredoxin